MSYQHMPLPLHIAIIDDQVDDILLIEQSLAELQYQVRISRAHDSPEAGRLLTHLAEQGDSPDLVLIDIRLPNGSGFEVLRQVRRQGALASTPIIMITSQMQDGDLECATALGACDLLVKPNNLDALFRQLVSTITLHCPYQLAGRDSN